MLVDPPRIDRNEYGRQTQIRDAPAPRARVDYLALEARNRSLGHAGETFAMNFEIARLLAEGSDRLAARVDHVSSSRGDGPGYDILSFQSSGATRLIEVKTTAGGNQTPFYVTRNESRCLVREGLDLSRVPRVRFPERSAVVREEGSDRGGVSD